jgi:hypothetical protein
LAARIGKAQAVTATARKLAVLFYKALRFGLAYADPGVSAYEARYRHRLVQHLERRATSLGFTLVAKAGYQEFLRKGRPSSRSTSDEIWVHRRWRRHITRWPCCVVVCA